MDDTIPLIVRIIRSHAPLTSGVMSGCVVLNAGLQVIRLGLPLPNSPPPSDLITRTRAPSCLSSFASLKGKVLLRSFMFMHSSHTTARAILCLAGLDPSCDHRLM